MLKSEWNLQFFQTLGWLWACHLLWISSQNHCEYSSLINRATWPGLTVSQNCLGIWKGEYIVLKYGMKNSVNPTTIMHVTKTFIGNHSPVADTYMLKGSPWLITKSPNRSSKATSPVLWQPILMIKPTHYFLGFVLNCPSPHLCARRGRSLPVPQLQFKHGHVFLGSSWAFCLRQRPKSFLLFSNPSRPRPRL